MRHELWAQSTSVFERLIHGLLVNILFFLQKYPTRIFLTGDMGKRTLLMGCLISAISNE